MRILLALIFLLGFVHMNAFADDTSKIMSALSTDLDIAESSLRTILNKPAANGNYPNASCEAKLKASMALLNFETRHPGYLQGKHGTTTWGQYNGVRSLFDQLSEKYQFFYSKSSAAAAAQSVK